MPQDAPADTAGPSSPPPRMPEGWLPQWEGVQRKWYYVQRATGKSQWEIPTEPVVLTPSTTPTSIGNGPSQAPPSRQSTNTPVDACPQPQWRVEPESAQQTTQRQTVSQYHEPGTLSPYSSSHFIPQLADWPRRDMQSSSSQRFDPSRSGSDYNTSNTTYVSQQCSDSSGTYYPTSVNNTPCATGHQIVRSNSYQAAFNHQLGHGPNSVGRYPSHHYPQQAPHTSTQYSNNSTHSQSRTNFSPMAYLSGPEPQNNVQFYQNSHIQTGIHQPHQQASQPTSNIAPHGFYQNTYSTNQQQQQQQQQQQHHHHHHHHDYYQQQQQQQQQQQEEQPQQRQQWPNTDPRLSHISASDPQFISGPWGSTPPA